LGIASEHASVTDTSKEAKVEHQGSRLILHFNPENGEGSWSVTHPEREECGVFRIDEHGALTFPAATKEIDQAAIDWIGYLGRDRIPEHQPMRSSEPTVHP
jgi:hypothetical protein